MGYNALTDCESLIYELEYNELLYQSDSLSTFLDHALVRMQGLAFFKF